MVEQAAEMTEEQIGDALVSSLEGTLDEGQEELEEGLEAAPEGEEGDLLYDDLPLTAKERAEALGVDVNLFYDTKFAFSDGSDPMSASEMNDWIQEHKQNDAGLVDLKQQQAAFVEQQQVAQAQQHFAKQYGQPISRAEGIHRELKQQYEGANWNQLITEHGDAAKIKKLEMEQSINEVEGDLRQMVGEYRQAMGGFQGNVRNTEIQKLGQMHPEWSTPEIGLEGLRQIHAGLPAGMISFEEMVGNLIDKPNGSAMLRLYEQASTGNAVSSMDENKVRTAAKGLKSGRTISMSQQRKMQMGKALKAAAGGTRAQKTAAADVLLKQAGLI